MRTAAGIAAWLMSALALPAHANEGLRDPTRPPAGFSDAESVARPARGEPVLQSVMISPSARAAIISGEIVRLGETFGDSRLVRVQDEEVVLRNGNGEQVLHLYPGVDKDAALGTGKTAAAVRSHDAGSAAGTDADGAKR